MQLKFTRILVKLPLTDTPSVSKNTNFGNETILMQNWYIKKEIKSVLVENRTHSEKKNFSKIKCFYL